MHLLFLLLFLACDTSPRTESFRDQPLALTAHGACRMECRHLSRDDVAHVIATGTLDPDRSRLDGACPSHALDGTTLDGRRARVVVAACTGETRVVTAIDLDGEWPCDCP